MQRFTSSSGQFASCRLWLEGDVLSEKAKQRLQCILAYVESDASIAEIASQYGITSGTLRRWVEHFDPHDSSSLQDRSSRPHTLRATQLSAEAVQKIRDLRTTSPKIGKEEIAQTLQTQFGITASASAIGRVIEKECLYFADSALHIRKRLRAQMIASAPVQQIVSQAPVALTQRTSAIVPATNARRVWLVSSFMISALMLAITLSYNAGRIAASVQDNSPPAIPLHSSLRNEP